MLLSCRGAGNLLRFDKWNTTTSTPAYARADTVRYILNGANQITCIDADASHTCNGSETVWEYDAYGNLLDDGTTQYTYDPANRVASITAASVTTTYTYNGDSDRIAQTVGTVTTTYVLDTATPLTMALSETTGTSTKRYWHALDTLAQSDGTTTEYFAYDGLGSVRQLLDASGSVGLAQTFDPYGSGYAKAGSARSTLGYTGEQTDSNGFVYLRARYYQPGMGRFTQMDPSRAEKNPYQYGASNPVMFVDPSGLVYCDPMTMSSFECADEIIRENKGLEALKKLFTDKELDKYTLFSVVAAHPSVSSRYIPGETAKERLSWIIRYARGTRWRDFIARPQKPINGDGIDISYDDGTGDQLGTHFLSAVRLGFDRSAGFWELAANTAVLVGARSVDELMIRFMIGHELIDSTYITEAMAPSETDVQHFVDGLHYDRVGSNLSRDLELWRIFQANNLVATGSDGLATTIGDGSMEDLRLSLKGYRFGEEVRIGYDKQNYAYTPLVTREEAAAWLQRNLAPPQESLKTLLPMPCPFQQCCY